MIRYFLPTGQQFVTKNMEIVAHAHSGVRVASVVMLLVSSTGVFLPLEVALNRVWGVTKNRSYIMNQLVSLGLAAGIGTLALVSVAVTAAQRSVLQILFFGHTDNIGLQLCLPLAAADFGGRRQCPAFLPHLLGSSQPQAARPRGAADRHRDWALVGGGQDAVRGSPALDGPAKGIRSLLRLRELDVVGVRDRPAAAWRGHTTRPRATPCASPTWQTWNAPKKKSRSAELLGRSVTRAFTWIGETDGYPETSASC